VDEPFAIDRLQISTKAEQDNMAHHDQAPRFFARRRCANFLRRSARVCLKRARGSLC
jgi:hypothetical protein